ncbi:cytochrome oxidase small assembly protein [Comamonas serinivorans]|nr:cytochrome oxidase small assembly protein [Comamonas serinivorans]
MALNTEQRKSNLRLALILASVALVFLLGFVVKMLWLSGQ